MESNKRELQTKSRTRREGTHLTRLQKHAPHALQLDDVNRDVHASPCVIPLLSPLVLSPPRELDHQQPSNGGSDGGDDGVNQQGRICQAYDHSAIGALTILTLGCLLRRNPNQNLNSPVALLKRMSLLCMCIMPSFKMHFHLFLARVTLSNCVKTRCVVFRSSCWST